MDRMTLTRNDEPIVCIVGPTATGKTAVAVDLAREIHGEVISADSMAIYKGMDIGTAKPTMRERSLATFHLVDVVDPDESFNVARFSQLAEQAYQQILTNNRRTILAGGTGLYIRAFLEGFNLTETPGEPMLRQALEERARREGVASLHEELCRVDAEAGRRIHPNDRIRIIRALEVHHRTGIPISVQHKRDKENRTPKKALKFALNLDRETLYSRIDERVQRMIADGLEEEVRSLLARGVPTNSQSMRSLGYKEMVRYIQGEIDHPTAVELIKSNTRKFAKRQLVWFRADADLIWLEVKGMESYQVARMILSLL
jgi:tRNA dimethylallyltransferase